MALFLLWWTVDDTIAQALTSPGLGSLPWWTVLILGLAIGWTAEAHAVVKVKKKQVR
ncbi:MAG: hypothetical protein AAFR38_05990 [Planctomycetota bacterium]